MKEATQQYSDITYNTFADVIDWDDLTEKDYQTIQELKENGITICVVYVTDMMVRTIHDVLTILLLAQE